MSLYNLTPPLSKNDELFFGDSKLRKTDYLYLGELAEFGPKRKIQFDCSGEHVVAIVGKRGSGKSYTLGSILESLASSSDNSKISSFSTKHGVLLFDTLDIYWSLKHNLKESENPIIKEQFSHTKKFNLSQEDINVDLWIPSGYEVKEIDPADSKKFSLNISELEPSDWAIIFDIDLISEPRGHLINDLYRKITKEGWNSSNAKIEPQNNFSFEDFIDCLNNDDEINIEYNKETIRSVRQRFQTLSGMELFDQSGTQLTDLIKAGSVSVLMLSRLDTSTRELIATVLFKKILENRNRASTASKQLKISPSLTPEQKKSLQRYVKSRIPRTWIAIDEAQNLIPSGKSTLANSLIAKYVKEGRNFGLSLIVTTQQPSSLDKQIMSQLDTLIVHQLSTANDIKYVEANIKSDLPDKISQKNTVFDIPKLLRNLEQGTVFVTCTETTEDIPRSFIMKVRPRITIHGGFED